jgi:hypothetical protein
LLDIEIVIGEIEISKKKVQLASLMQQFMDEKGINVLFCLAQQVSFFFVISTQNG